MSDLLLIGASGVRAYQTALNVVGENISNAGTQGYVRRDAVIKEAAAGAGGYPLQIYQRVLGGADATGVARSWDAFRAADVRNTGSELARTQGGIVWLERIESALDKNALGKGLTSFFNAAQSLAADPTSTATRAAFLETSSALAASFRATAEGLAAVGSDLQASAQIAVGELNDLAKSLATVNAGLSRARAGSNGQAQLMDERDRLLDRMSTIASINVKMTDAGVATVALNSANGPVLVDGVNAEELTLSVNPSGSFALTLDPFGNPQAITLKSGTLAGFADASTRVVDARNEIDRIATTFADTVNAVQAGGVDLNGNAGQPMFDASGGAANFTMLLTDPRSIAAAAAWTVTTPSSNAGSGSIKVTTDPSGTPSPAVNLSISGGVLSAIDPVTGTVIASTPYVAGQPVTLAGLNVTVTGTPADGDRFSVAATGAGSRDNGALATLADARRTGNFEGAVATLTTSNAATLSARRTVADAQSAIKDGAIAARDNLSGVNLDNEAVELMRFQQAYQASSRVIQVSREIFQTILDAS